MKSCDSHLYNQSYFRYVEEIHLQHKTKLIMGNSINKYEAKNVSTYERKVLTGMFRDRESTENAYNSLNERGYSKDDIHLVMSEKTMKFDYEVDANKKNKISTKASARAGKGSAIGGAIGAIVGVIAAIGTSVLIPGFGVLVAGSLAVGLVGAGAGGITGGVIGVFVSLGIPEAKAKLYESGLKEGNVVISVMPRNDEDAKFLENNWRANRVEEIHW